MSDVLHTVIIGVANVGCGGYPLRCLLAALSWTVSLQFSRPGTLARFVVSILRQDSDLRQFSHQSIFVQRHEQAFSRCRVSVSSSQTVKE